MTRNKRSLWLLVLVLLVCMVLSACGAPTPGPAVDTACDWVRPIYRGSGDRLTKQTAAEILAHNDKWQANCPARAARNNAR